MPDQPRSIEKLSPAPDSDSRPRAHNDMPLPLGQPQVGSADQRNLGTQDGVRNFFLNKLANERETGQVASNTSADPVITDQGQPPAVPTQQREQPIQDDIQQPPVQQSTGAEQPEEPALQADSDQLPLDEVEATEQSPEQLPDGLDIDGKRYTADEIKSLIEEANNGGMRLDDYKRKTQYLSRVRQEHEALGTSLNESVESLGQKEQIINRVLQANLQAYENVDTSRLDAQQFEEFKRQYASARQGADAMRRAFEEADSELKKRQGDAFAHQSASTREMLQWHEPRWDNENVFYGQVREFAVNEGLMTAEAFDRENDFLKITGLIAMMDRHQLPQTISERTENPKPPAAQRNQQRPRNDQGRFTANVAATKTAVLSSPNARGDGSLRNHFMANLEREGKQTPRR